MKGIVNHMLTRKEKYARVRAEIEMQNIEAIFAHFDEYLEIMLHQDEIKKELGCKH